jgi:hypothetical protein
MSFLGIDIYVYINFKVDTYKELLGIKLADKKRKIETGISEISEETIIYIRLKIFLENYNI